MDRSADASSTSRHRPSPGSPPSPPGSSRSSSSGRRAVRDLAARHGIRPRKALGQNFLIDPNLARAIVGDADVSPGDRVLEIGAGLGSVTVALADAGAWVLAVESDPAVIPALREAVGDRERVRVLAADALRVNWRTALPGGEWRMVSNLPYNVAVQVVFGLLERAPQVIEYLVMVQREVGERLVAGPGDPAYGAASARLAYLASASLIRRVPADVFWPRPKVESVLLRIVPAEPAPIVVDRDALFRVIEAGFAQRRKTMRNALVRLGLSPLSAMEALRACGLGPTVRAEEIGLADLACLAEAVRSADG